jgi:hypothetical protein
MQSRPPSPPPLSPALQVRQPEQMGRPRASVPPRNSGHPTQRYTIPPSRRGQRPPAHSLHKADTTPRVSHDTINASNGSDGMPRVPASVPRRTAPRNSAGLAEPPRLQMAGRRPKINSPCTPTHPARSPNRPRPRPNCRGMWPRPAGSRHELGQTPEPRPASPNPSDCKWPAGYQKSTAPAPQTKGPPSIDSPGPANKGTTLRRTPHGPQTDPAPVRIVVDDRPDVTTNSAGLPNPRDLQMAGQQPQNKSA